MELAARTRGADKKADEAVSKLVVFRGTRPERYVDLTDRDLRIGRAADNDIVLDDPDRTVSRFHAELRYENGRFVLIDLNSQNGLWMDGQRLPRLTLEPGRPVTVGMFRLLLEEDSGRMATAAPTDATIMVSDAGAIAAGPQTLDGAALTTNPQPPPPAPAVVAAPPPAPAPARVQAAPAGKKAAAPKPKPAPGDQVSLISKIARPKVMLSVIGLMFLLLVARMLLDSGEAPPAQQTQTTTPSQPQETNEQLIARHIADGKARMASGDYDGAIEAFQRALIIDQESPEALELKIKAEEAKRAQPPVEEAQAQTQPSEPPKPAEPPAEKATTKPSGSTATTEPRPARRSTTKSPALTPAQRDLQQRYAAAKSALERGRYAEAAAGFDAILQLQPGYEDAAVLLARARTAQKTQATEALQAGRQLAQAGNLLGAREAYLQARTFDPALPGLAEAMASLTEQMRDAGEQAYRKARQYDAVGRSADAIPLYRQAVQYLPDSDPNKKVAQDRLAALRGAQ